jgi:hypothetical protein
MEELYLAIFFIMVLKAPPTCSPLFRLFVGQDGVIVFIWQLFVFFQPPKLLVSSELLPPYSLPNLFFCAFSFYGCLATPFIVILHNKV